MRRRRVLFIGLGWEQFDLARRLREEGHRVLALSAFSASALRGIADETRAVSPLDGPGVLAAARDLRAEAVVSDQCDYSRYAEETVAAALGLKDRPTGTAVGVSKLLQRRLAHGLARQPEHRICHDSASALAAFRALGGDVVVKPVDSRGSLGVARVRRTADVPAAYDAARRNGVLGPVIVESFRPGELLTFDGVVVRGVFRLKAVSRSTHSAAGTVRLLQHVYRAPADEAALSAKAAPALEKMCRVMGLTSGFVHSEWLWDGRALSFIELANRAPGIRAASRMMSPLCGEDLYAAVYPALLRPRPVARRKYFVQHFHFGPARLAGRHFLSPAARRDPRLADYLPWPGSASRASGEIVRLGHATFGGNSLAPLLALAAGCGASQKGLR